ncbi:MAG: CDP-diacylglycerol--glycerol-3-phosphate 3-phosphatidyltransferase [Coriobacteriia bacterium]|nr:CDP-diacylglycerol--glycerol-3-phosphate 3-phosphatidyltransferase [Coriobacteriia bacterium]
MKWTSANTVTVIRILFVPVFVVALLSPWPRWIDGSGSIDFIKPWVALLIFVVLSLTDSLDGYLARSKNQVTNFGKFMDPLADKILVFAALLAFIELGVLPSWVVLVILIREFIVAGARMLAASQGKVVAASWYGKAKTVTQIIAIVLFILKMALTDYSDPLYIIAWIVMIVALILTVVSMIDYLIKCKDVFSDNNDARDVINLATKKNLKIGCAESLTGGKVASSLTEIPGASLVFMGGIVSYDYDVKSKILDVDNTHLKKNGAINAKTAEDMAVGARKKLNCDIAVSTTGIAGPDTDEFDTPIGRVYIGVATKDSVSSHEYNFSGNREQIQQLSVDNAISLLKKTIKQCQ